jgi:hypothetical protein
MDTYESTKISKSNDEIPVDSICEASCDISAKIRGL